MLPFPEIANEVLEWLVIIAIALIPWNKKMRDKINKRNREQYGFDKFPTIFDIFKKK